MRYFFTCLLLFLVFSREDVLGCGVSRCHRPRARIWREWNIKGKQGSIVIHKFLSKKLVRLCVCTLNNIKQDLTVILVHFPFIIAQIMSSKRCLLKQDNEVSFSEHGYWFMSSALLLSNTAFKVFSRSRQTSICLAKESI